MGAVLESRYAIPLRRLTGICSPWAAKRLDEFDGDLSKFTVVRMYPSRLRQIGVAKTEPGDENNQDISALVGKVDIRKLEMFSQHDPDAYSYSGGLNRTTQGLLEFVEMFKAPIKVLHPAADRDAGGQLRRHREYRRDARTRASSSPIPTNRSGSSSRTTEQRGLSRSHLRRQGAVLPARHRRGDDLRQAPGEQRPRPARRARRRCWRCWPASAFSRASRSTRTRRFTRRCASITARA